MVFKRQRNFSNAFGFKDCLYYDLVSRFFYKIQCGRCNSSYQVQTKIQYFDFQTKKITQKDFKNVNSSNLIVFFKRKKWNPKVKNEEQKNTNQTHGKC